MSQLRRTMHGQSSTGERVRSILIQFRRGFTPISAAIHSTASRLFPRLGAPIRSGNCTMTQVLECLTKHGQRLDSEIAEEIGVPLAKVRQQLASLAATGEIITCNLTRFEKNGKRIEALQCRVSGYVPPLAPGRKAKPTTVSGPVR
ncbi:MAG TPA: hypothetical protein VMN79_00970 [Casimicrobiaceae bacterium]|nr:hypothetical protein [Casimicrobiaceae bacterium]